MFGTRPITFVNGAVVAPDGRVADSLRVRGGVIDAIGDAPRRADVVVDVDGAVVLPGLVNAHDHLELNSFGRLKWRSQYVNVREWIADFQPRFGGGPLALARPDTLADRVWVGGLKNLLSGVTTVCHHNPIHAPLKRRFPVRIVRQFGLSHSLQIDGSQVAESYARTPARWPWIIHAAEGIDAEAGQEIDTLGTLRCLGENTVLVHGVALDGARAELVLARGGALIWCPTSNEFLFGRTADVRRFSAAGRLALGSDSRLSGEGDLLDEIRAAFRTRQLSAEQLLRSVTRDAAAVLRLPHGGGLEIGQPADVVLLRRVTDDPCESVAASTRADVRLCLVGGEPLVGDTALRAVFDSRRQPAARVRVDGRERLMARWIARRVAALDLAEPGLELVA